MTTTRRSLIKTSSGALAASTLAFAVPARADSMPKVAWRLQSSFPKSFEIIWAGCEILAREVSALTGGRFVITPSPASAFGEPPTAIDTLTADRVEMCHAWAAENMSKDPTLALMTAMPFGLDARLASSFLHEQGGLTLINEFLTKSGFIAFPGGNTGAAMGGWYHREITQPDDLKGLKIRSDGLASNVLTTLGATPVTRSANELRPALESRDIDGAHWFGPFDDDALGLWRAARYYYYPGWWSGGTMLYFIVNKARYDALPSEYQAALAAAAAVADRHVLARYDALNIIALRRLVAGGAELKTFPEPVLNAAFDASTASLDTIATSNASFKSLLEAIRKSRANGYLWHQVAEHAFGTYMMMLQRQGRL